jgi:hypothetical protein
MLLIDQTAGGRDDRRLVGRIEADEPAENTELLARLYLKDPSRGHCRPLSAEDLDPRLDEHPADDPSAVCWNAPLIAGIGVTFRIQLLGTDTREHLRWTRTFNSQRGRAVRGGVSPSRRWAAAGLPVRDHDDR